MNSITMIERIAVATEVVHLDDVRMAQLRD